jgi:hypothetical protein
MLALLSDAELSAAVARAWRESARCWAVLRAYDREYRVSSLRGRARADAAATVETARILAESAQSAEDYWRELRAESERRAMAQGLED